MRSRSVEGRGEGGVRPSRLFCLPLRGSRLLLPGGARCGPGAETGCLEPAQGRRPGGIERRSRSREAGALDLPGLGRGESRERSGVQGSQAQGTDSRAPGGALRGQVRGGAGGASGARGRPAPSPRVPAEPAAPGPPQAIPGRPPDAPHPASPASALSRGVSAEPAESLYKNCQPASQIYLPEELGTGRREASVAKRSPSQRTPLSAKHSPNTPSHISKQELQISSKPQQTPFSCVLNPSSDHASIGKHLLSTY